MPEPGALGDGAGSLDSGMQITSSSSVPGVTTLLDGHLHSITKVVLEQTRSSSHITERFGAGGGKDLLCPLLAFTVDLIVKCPLGAPLATYEKHRGTYRKGVQRKPAEHLEMLCASGLLLSQAGSVPRLQVDHLQRTREGSFRIWFFSGNRRNEEGQAV